MQTNYNGTATPVPGDVLDVAIEAARRAGGELIARFGREPAGVASKRDITDLVSDADRAAEKAVAGVLGFTTPSHARRAPWRS